MSALSASRMTRVESWTYHDFTLTSGQVAYKGGMAVVDTNASTGQVIVGSTSTTQVLFGIFDADVDATSAAKTCRVNFLRARDVIWFDGSGIAATDLGKLCYILYDNTVSLTATGKSPAGMIMGYDSVKGVAVDISLRAISTSTAPTITTFANATHGHADDAGGGVLAAPAITSFASATHGHTNAAGGGVLAAPAITSFASATHDHQAAAGGGVLAAPGITAFTNANHTHASTAQGGGIRRAAGASLSWTGVTCTITAPGNWLYYIAPVAATQASVIALGTSGAVVGDNVVFTSAGAITQTITYYDGSTARTAALSASKSHRVQACYDGAVWCFSYTVGAN